MRKISVALPPLALLLLLAAAPAPAGDFRNAEWGMSMEEVKASENLPLAGKTSLSLTYLTTLHGAATTVVYEFVEGKLASASYSLREGLSDPGFCLRYYTTLTDALKDEYGAPTKNVVRAPSDDIRDNPGTWETALADGSLFRAMQWETEGTIIFARLFGKPPKLGCSLFHATPEYVAAQKTHAEQARERRAKRREGDFRGADWGMSKAQVKAQEYRQLVDEHPNLLRYGTMFAGDHVAIIYNFADDKLMRGEYVLLETQHDGAWHLRHYDTVTELLKKRFGAPERDGAYYRSIDVRDNPDTWAAALEAGELMKFMQWKSDETIITAMLKSPGGNMRFGVEYASTRLGYLEPDSRKKSFQDLQKKIHAVRSQLPELEKMAQEAEDPAKAERLRQHVQMRKEGLQALEGMLQDEATRTAKPTDGQ